MSVALMDARSASQVKETCHFLVTPDLVYADDTMLIASSASDAQRYLDQVIKVGHTYGLELNTQKIPFCFGF